jgi:O-antigen/teichoic acid export membrane protein
MIEGGLAVVYCLPALWILVIYNRKESKPIMRSNAKPVTQARVIRFGLFSSLNELGAGIVGKTSDYFIISAISSPYYVGIYAFAYKIYSIIFRLLPLKDFQSVLRPLFFQKFTEKYDKEEFIRVYNFIIKVMIPVYLLPAVYFLIFGRKIIEFVYDPRYLDAYVVTCIVLFSNTIVALFYPQGLAIILKERMDIALYSKGVVIFSIVAGIFGMKWFGIIGVAIATMIGDFLRNLFMHLMLKGKVDMEYRIGELKNYLLISGFLIVTFYFAQYIVTGLISLMAISFAFLLVSGLLLIVFHPFNSDELNILNRISKTTGPFSRITPYIIKINHLRPKKRLIVPVE